MKVPLKKSFAPTLLLLSLVTLSVVDVRPIKAQNRGNITINIDGSISPSTAPIQRTSYVFSLISDVVGSIIVHTSNIILDGGGHTVSGVSLQGTSNVTVKNFVVASQGERFGMSLNDASNNLVINNTVSGFWSIQALNGISFAGIYVIGGGSNTITQNNLLYNLDGMDFVNTSFNLIVQNNITSNPVWSPYTTGISFVGASNNTVYHNNFVNSHYQVQVSESTNSWDNGYPNGGNYWSDYKTKYPNVGMIEKSGLGNTPYTVDPQNQDRYPFMQPFNSTLYALQTIPPKISLLSPINKEYNESSVPLLFTVDKTVSWIGYSLDSNQNVTATGNSTLANMTNGSHRITVYANDTFGIIGASETNIFTISKPEPFPVVPVAATIVVITAVGAGLLLIRRKRRKEAPQI